MLIPLVLLHQPDRDRRALTTFLKQRGHAVELVDTLDQLRENLVDDGFIGVIVARRALLPAPGVSGNLGDRPILIIGSGNSHPDFPVSEIVPEPYYLSDVGQAIDRLESRRETPTKRPDPTPPEGTPEKARPAAGMAAVLRGLSHAMNNPLSAALGWMQILQTSVGPDDSGHRAITQLEREFRNLERISTAIALIGERPGGPRGAVDLAGLIQVRVEALRAEELPVELVREEAELPPILGDTAELDLVFDLIFGAFLEERSRVAGIEITLGVHEGRLAITIEESGGTLPAGIAPSDLGLLLKSERYSRALGIALAHAIIERRLGGSVRLVASGGSTPRLEFAVPVLPSENERGVSVS